MITITGYDKELVFFECECGYSAVESISNKITKDCVFKVDVTCMKCGDTGRVYYMHNSTEAIAKEMLAEFEALKIE